MAAQTPNIHSSQDMINAVSERGPHLTFDPKRGWVFKSEMLREITRIGVEETRNVATSAMWGAIGGSASGIFKWVRWYMTPAPALSWIQRIKNWGAKPVELFLGQEMWSGAVSGVRESVRVAAPESGFRVLKKVLVVIRPESIGQLDERTNRIMKALFKKVAPNVNVVCRLSRDIFHVPVKTNCSNGLQFSPHIFEFAQLKDRIRQGDSTCPFPGCGQNISLETITFAAGKRNQVSEVVQCTLHWLASQITEEKSESSGPLTGREKKEFLENEEQILRNIRSENLTGREWQILMNLVKDSAKRFNDDIDKIYRAINMQISVDQELTVNQVLSLNGWLARWHSSSTIEIERSSSRNTN